MYVSCSFCLNMWCAGFKDKLQINIKVNHGSIDVSDQYMWKMKWKSACGLKPHKPQLKPAPTSLVSVYQRIVICPPYAKIYNSSWYRYFKSLARKGGEN